MPPDPSPERGNEPNAGSPEGGGDGGNLLADPVNDTGAPLNLDSRFSQERTLMGWVRTCFSIIGFGFTIFTFFPSHRSPEELAAHPVQPRILCVALTFGGTLFMALAVAQYRLAMTKLRELGLEPGFSMATFTSVLVCAAGLLGTWVILAE